ncbi:MAG: hypothetical protein AAFN18_13565 [Cyanobacteria bacterium J06554_6]
MLEAWCGGSPQSCSRARYIERGGEQSSPQPTLSQQSLLYSFIFEGSLSHLQTLCDRTLNAVAKGKIHYKPVLPFVMVTFGDNPMLRSQAPGKQNAGYVPEREVMVWVLTAAGYQLGPLFWVDHVAWYTPYVFVDSSYAMVGGREIYGFPKEWGWVELATDPQQLDRLSVEAAVFPTFGPNVGATRQPVITLERQSKEKLLPTLWRTQQDCFSAVIQALLGDDPEIPILGPGFALRALSDLLTKSVPFVFLKQFRSVHRADVPCYQAIVEASTQLVKFRGGNLINADFKVEIQNFESHPLVTELGLSSQSPRVELAFWTQFDFTLGTGKTIVRTA